MDHRVPLLFALSASRAFGKAVAEKLGTALSEHEERAFEDGEHKIRPLVNVRGRDVFVIHSLYTDAGETVNDKLCRLLFFIGALRDASARQITAVIPYLAYARKDAKTQPRDPTTTRYIAQMIEAVGTDRVMTLDVHNLQAYQNSFRIRAEHLEATKLFAAYFLPTLKDAAKVAVISPDAGGIKRAERFRSALGQVLERDIGSGFMEKARAKGVMTAGRLIGDVADGVVIILDDLISTGGTLLSAAKLCKAHGARAVYAVASHGVFVGNADKLLATDEVEQVVVTDTIPPFRLDAELVERKLAVVSAAALFAEAIRRVHEGGSLVELLQS